MFKKSIKSHLFFFLSTLITITILIIALISFLMTKHEANEIFDSSLVRTSKLLLSLTKHEIIEHETKDHFIIDLGLAEERTFHRYENKMHFQIWKEDYLIYNSSADFAVEKPRSEGFNEMKVNNKKWRGFTIYDEESDLTIEVLEDNDIREEMVIAILGTILLPISFSFLPILLIIWFVVNKGLISLTSLSNEIRNISPLFLSPFKKDKKLPDEITPIVDSLNFLLLKLDESMNSERKFINYASHELRTPLAVIKTRTQFLIKKYSSNSELSKDLNDVLIAVDRIIDLSNQLLLLSRVDAENKILTKEEINLGEIVTEVTGNFYHEAKNKNINFISKISDQCCIKANKFYIEIMLNNLFSNAIKYSYEQEDILINLSKEKNKIHFSITNKGKTVSKENLEKVFDRFYRIDTSKPGSGLGLSIVKKISDLYRAKIKFTSENEVNSFEIFF